MLYHGGLQAFTAGDYQTAVDNFQELIRIFGNEPELQMALEVVYYAMGSAYYNLQQYVESAKAFETYLSKFPEAKYRDEALFRIAAGAQNEEDYERAVKGYRRLLAEVPSSDYCEDAAFQVGVCFLQLDDHKRTIEAFEQFTGAFPRSELFAQARIYMARSHFELSEYGEALDILESLDNYNRSIDHIVYANFLALEIGDISFDETQYETALRAYRRVRTRESLVRLQETYISRLQYQLKVLNQKRGQADSLKSFFRAERRVRRALGAAEELLGRLEGMPAYDAGLFHRIGSCFFSTDRYWEARVAFERVVREAEDTDIREAAHFDLALVLMQLRRFPDLIEAADAYLADFSDEDKFVKNGRVASMAFMRAESYINQERFEEAEKEMLRLREEFPSFVQMERVDFYIALSVAMQERFEEGIGRFDRWLDQYPDHILRPEVEYWLPIALYYKGDYDKAIPMFRSYGDKYPMSIYAPEAGYREAMCYYAKEDFETCARLLLDWIGNNKGHYFYWEAVVNAADALAGIGELEQARDLYATVTTEAGHFYFLALTHSAKVYRALDTQKDYSEMSRLFGQYIKDNPESPNIIEAAHEAGWALRQIGRTGDARKFYWSIITRHGNTRGWEGFDQLLKDLRKMYTLEEAPVLGREFQENLDKSLAEKRMTLAARLQQAMITRTNALMASTETYEMATRYSVDDLGAENLAFLGGFFVEEGKQDKGMEYLEALLTNFPEAVSVAVAHAQKARVYLEQGDASNALLSAQATLEYALEPDVYLSALFRRAEALRLLGEVAPAMEDYKQVLANRAAPRELKPRCLLGLAACHEALGEFDKAIPFYQRIYVLYGAYREAVARAYLQSGLAFEKISDREAAVRTYQELLSQEDLLQTPEADEARTRLSELNV